MWLEVLSWIDHVWSSSECVCCACYPNVSFHMLEVISSFKCLRAVSDVFALLMLFLCVIFHTMWSGKSV